MFPECYGNSKIRTRLENFNGGLPTEQKRSYTGVITGKTVWFWEFASERKCGDAPAGASTLPESFCRVRC